MSLLPVALYGLEVPTGSRMIPAMQEDSIPNAAYRITMAALDPTEPPEADEDGNLPNIPRSTLKLIRKRPNLDDELDDEYLERLMAGGSDDDDEEDSDDNDEPNGGPSDPAKSKKAKKEAAMMKLIAAVNEDESDEEMGEDGKPNGVKASKKGKEPATSSDDDDDDSIDSGDLDDIEELVICTLDTERNYQQALDIVIGPEEEVYFIVKGTHAIHLTGNYIIDTDDTSSDEDDDEEDYEFPIGMDGIEEYDSDDSEADELDDISDPRVTEVDSEEEETPKAVVSKKGKNKRPAEEEVDGLDEMIAKASAGETKLSKKQQKKLKNNKGESVEATAETAKDTPTKGDKKVQFAKNLEQGPTGSTIAEKGATLGVKLVQGVTVDDRKIGSGRTVKKGNKVEVRYIGKLENGKVFDSNKKGKPFSFSAGTGQVIKGWDIGVVGMAVGGERRLTIPANLAYGSKSQPGIPGNSTLIFDVKLLGIK
ncbi:Uu.00g038370.m01.CDS01 [Anthostomella pinea]|uniref:FK506-binding protein n=1 Tax=Anthostomella pinea TaxID=933095 RepID=A0AAI8YBB7_9PEZI|nr:Uu.00g038370.m01.CDS01 [Anthostomella pinea]